MFQLDSNKAQLGGVNDIILHSYINMFQLDFDKSS